MAYAAISHWQATEWTDEMEDIARNTFVPLILSVGAERVQMIRTGELTFTVVTEYADEAAAQSAQDRIADIRAKAANELPMSMLEHATGDVFASG